MAQQTAEHCILIPKGHPTRTTQAPFPRYRRQAALWCSNLIVAIGGARLMAPAHSHNHYEETIYGVDRALTLDSVAVTAELAKCNLLEWAEPLGSSAQMLPSLGLVSLSGELMSQEIRGSFAWGD